MRNMEDSSTLDIWGHKAHIEPSGSRAVNIGWKGKLCASTLPPNSIPSCASCSRCPYPPSALLSHWIKSIVTFPSAPLSRSHQIKCCSVSLRIYQNELLGRKRFLSTLVSASFYLFGLFLLSFPADFPGHVFHMQKRLAFPLFPKWKICGLTQKQPCASLKRWFILFHRVRDLKGEI